MPSFSDYRTRVFNDFYDEIIRLFKILPLTESMRRDILNSLGSPNDYRPDVEQCQLCGRLMGAANRLIAIYPNKKFYLDTLITKMGCK